MILGAKRGTQNGRRILPPRTLFEQQVSWELEHIERADLVFFRFGAEGPAVVSMLEAGLTIGRGKAVIILADPGYMR